MQIKKQHRAVASSNDLNLRDNQGQQRRVLVGQVAHVGVINIAADEPSHDAADKNVRRKMPLGRDARCTDHCGQAVGHHADDRLVLVFVADQRCDGPHLNGVA